MPLDLVVLLGYGSIRVFVLSSFCHIFRVKSRVFTFSCGSVVGISDDSSAAVPSVILLFAHINSQQYLIVGHARQDPN